MANYLRPRVTGATVFFTVCLQQRGSSLLLDHIGVLRDAVRAAKAARPFEIVAMVVLPDHLHCIWRLPQGDSDYSVRMGGVKARFSATIRRAGFSPPASLPVVPSGKWAGLKPGLRTEKREAGIWQRRFWEHHIRCEQDLADHVRYCWDNPVRHGLVTQAADWPYSSVHRDRPVSASVSERAC